MRAAPLLLLGFSLGCKSESQVGSTDSSDDPSASGGEDSAAVDPGGDPDGTDDPGGATDDTAEDDQPSDYIFEEEEPEALLDAAGVEKGISDGILAMLAIDPADLHDNYASVIADPYDAVVNDGEDCPYYVDYYLEDYGYFYWSAACTARDDTYFSGYGISFDFDPFWSGGLHYDRYAYLSGTFQITDPEGYLLEGSGYSYDYEYEYPGNYSYRYGQISGTFSYNNPAAADSWLGQEMTVSLYMYSLNYNAWNPNYDGTNSQVNFTFTGSLGGLSGDINTIVLTDTFIYTAALGSACEAEPSGTISVRDSQGEWYDVYFQGPPYDGASVYPPDCDGCGQIYFRGDYLGDACPDFSPLTSWEDRPW